MGVSVDRNKHHGRKTSWDSRMSVSTMSTGATRQYRRSASSILSSDSDIRFTRRKLSRQYKCGCCILASFLVLLLAGAAAVYVGYTFYLTQPAEEQVFRGSMNVIDGDTFTTPMADLQTEDFRIKSRDYKERLNLLFRRSRYRLGFSGTDILALDGTEGKDLVVHFDIHIDPTYTTATGKDLQTLIFNEVSLGDESLYFRNLTIDPQSVEVIENHAIRTTTRRPSTYQIVSEAVTQTPIVRKCAPLQLDYCKKMDYNITTYPNIMGHMNLADLKEDVISFRELVDGECYRLAYDFVCNVLQPRCKLARGKKNDEIILPCRSYCRDFMTGCGGRLSPKMKESLDCNKFPEFGNADSTCIPKPGCVQEMQTRALSPRICDGVVDCQDLSDEKSCSYCPPNYTHCGIGRACIKESKRCDGKRDCPDGSDERACLTLAPSIQQMTKVGVVTPHLTRYHHEGFVVFNEKGEVGKLCTENLNNSIPANKTAEILHTVASSLCKTLSYESVTSVQVEKDAEENVAYVSMDDPTASEISFVRSDCKSKQVLKVTCANLECGLQITHMANPTLTKMSLHGDWPWHVALFKDDVHICDGTLVHADWVITSTSCFQGQPKAEWLVRAGTVRLSSSSPWQQERRIVGMVKSPVEGSTIAMVRLEDTLIMTDFVRPVCLPQQVQEDSMHCNTLGWARNRESLQRVEIKINAMEKCENISISTVNSVCTETAYEQEDCSEEEFAGSPMHCLLNDGTRWSLIGVANWRIACARNGMERPRLYDKIAPNYDWIQETIKADKADA